MRKNRKHNHIRRWAKNNGFKVNEEHQLVVIKEGRELSFGWIENVPTEVRDCAVKHFLETE